MELSKINAKIGEKSKPPIAGINFLIGSRILLETSSTIFHIKKLLDATDQRPLDAGLLWEVNENEGTGPDFQARIDAFLNK